MLQIENVDWDVEKMHLEMRVDFCDKHSWVDVFANPVSVRFEPSELKEDAEET